MPQNTGVVLWHGRYANKCYATEVWEAMSTVQQAGEICAGVYPDGRQRTKYRVEKNIPLVRFEERTLYLAGAGETDVLASWKHWRQPQMLVGAYQNPLPRLPAEGNVGSGKYYTGEPKNGRVTKKGLIVESSLNEEQVGQCFQLDCAMFRNKLGANMLQKHIRRDWHVTAKIAEAR